jgi:hypothetical protein
MSGEFAATGLAPLYRNRQPDCARDEYGQGPAERLHLINNVKIIRADCSTP